VSTSNANISRIAPLVIAGRRFDSEENGETVVTRAVRYQASVYRMSHSCNDGSFSCDEFTYFHSTSFYLHA